MRALGKFVLLRCTEIGVSPGGIHLPQVAQEKGETTGEVVSLGDKVDANLKTGDKVFFAINVGVKLPEHLGKHLRIIHQEHILAVL